MVLRTDLTNATDNEDTHVAQHNEVNTAVLALQTAHGTTSRVLQDIYGNGALPSDSIITLDDTRDALHVRDHTTPLDYLLKLTTSGDSPLVSVSAEALFSSVKIMATGGLEASGGGTSSAVLGEDAGADGDNAVGVGHDADASGAAAVAVGYGATASGAAAPVALGEGALSDGDSGVTVGKDARADGAAAVAVGADARGAGASSAAVGSNATASGLRALAIGLSATVEGDDSLAIGASSSAPGDTSVAVGRLAEAGTTLDDGNDSATAVGYQATATKLSSTAVGQAAAATANYATALGDSSVGSDTETVAVGYQATASDDGAVAMGRATTASGEESMALGADAVASHARSTALGSGAVTTSDDEVVLGAAGQAVSVPGVFAVTGPAAFTSPVGIGATLLVGGTGAYVSSQSTTQARLDMLNTTQSDADDARECRIDFRGKTAGGTTHGMGRIVVSHEGSGADQVGAMELRLNTGAQGNAPGIAATLSHLGALRAVGKLESGGELELGLAAGGSVLTDVSAATDQRTVTFPDADVDLAMGLVTFASGRTSVPSSQTGLALNFIGNASRTALPFGGEIVALGISSTNAAPGGETLTFRLIVDGVDTGKSLTLSDADDKTKVGTITPEALSAGSYFETVVDTSSGWTTSGVNLQVWVRAAHWA